MDSASCDAVAADWEKNVSNISKTVFAAAIFIAGSFSAHAQSRGDWVHGNYQGSGYWFPGVVEKVHDGKVTVVYDDGDRETLNRGNVKPYDWKVGSKVECNFKGQGDWYAARITSLSGAKISLTYEDGDKETTTTGFCRSN